MEQHNQNILLVGAVALVAVLMMYTSATGRGFLPPSLPSGPLDEFGAVQVAPDLSCVSLAEDGTEATPCTANANPKPIETNDCRSKGCKNPSENCVQRFDGLWECKKTYDYEGPCCKTSSGGVSALVPDRCNRLSGCGSLFSCSNSDECERSCVSTNQGNPSKDGTCECSDGPDDWCARMGGKCKAGRCEKAACKSSADCPVPAGFAPGCHNKCNNGKCTTDPDFSIEGCNKRKCTCSDGKTQGWQIRRGPGNWGKCEEGCPTGCTRQCPPVNGCPQKPNNACTGCVDVPDDNCPDTGGTNPKCSYSCQRNCDATNAPCVENPTALQNCMQQLSQGCGSGGGDSGGSGSCTNGGSPCNAPNVCEGTYDTSSNCCRGTCRDPTCSEQGGRPCPAGYECNDGTTQCCFGECSEVHSGYCGDGKCDSTIGENSLNCKDDCGDGCQYAADQCKNCKDSCYAAPPPDTEMPKYCGPAACENKNCKDICNACHVYACHSCPGVLDLPVECW